MIKKTILLSCLLNLVWTGSCFAETKWNESKGNHFIIYYKDAPEDFIDSIMESAEENYEEVTSSLGFSRSRSWTWDDRAKIYIYNDDKDYIASAEQASWSSGAASAKNRIIRTFPLMHGFFDSTLPHELGHIIFREFVGFSADVPLWLDEGVAMYQEKAKRWGVNQIVKEAVDQNRFIPLKELSQITLHSDTPKDLVDLFYAESASVVYYLIMELGQYNFVEFCQKLKEGKSLDAALKEAYSRFDNVDDLNRNWVDYLKR